MIPIRILYLINTLEAGGGQRYVVDIVRELDPQRFDVQLCSLGGGNMFEQEIAVPLLDLHASKQSRNLLGLLPLIRLVRSFRPHIIHTHLQYADTIGQFMGRYLCVPSIVTTIHGSTEWPRLQPSLLHLVEDCALEHADKIIVVADHLRTHLISKRHADSSKIVVMPCGVDLSPFLNISKGRSHTRRALHIPDDAMVFACSSQFRAEKRHDLLLHKFLQLPSTESLPLYLLLIGNGGASEQLIVNLISSMGLQERVRMIGGLKSDVAKWIHASDIYVMHSAEEGSSLAVVEAMAAGLPSLLPNAPHFSNQVRDQQEGLLFDFDNDQSFVHQALRLVESPELRSALGHKARQRAVALFGMDHHVDALSHVYEELIAKRRRSPSSPATVQRGGAF